MSLDSAVTTLVSRLEAVTARLESVEKQLAAGGGGGGGAAPAASSGPASGWLKEFDDLVADNIPAFVELSNKIGTDTVKQQAGLFQQAIAAHRAFLEMASKSKKPADLSKFLAPTSALVGSVIELRDKSRADKMFNWLSAVSEAIPLLGWVSVEKTPAPFINEFKGNSEFYSNKILMEFKKKGDAGKDNVEWVGKLSGFIKGLHAHVKSVHTTGLKWNAAGGDAYVPTGGAAPASAPAAGPPPPGPAPVIPKTEPTKSAGGGAGALFAQINKGGVTSGLKKVTNDMKVYKNPSLRAGAVVKADAIPAKKAAPKFGRQTKKGTPKFALEGNKWVIEFQDDNKEIVVENPETKHVVYIYGCNNSVINIKGKVNAVTVDNCKKCGICFTDAIASFELVNCQSIQAQCLGSVPSFAVDKTAGCQIILGKDGLGTELVQSKSSEMNIMMPQGDDLVELPVPEQFKTIIKDGKLITECVQHV